MNRKGYSVRVRTQHEHGEARWMRLGRGRSRALTYRRACRWAEAWRVAGYVAHVDLVH